RADPMAYGARYPEVLWGVLESSLSSHGGSAAQLLADDRETDRPARSIHSSVGARLRASLLASLARVRPEPPRPLDPPEPAPSRRERGGVGLRIYSDDDRRVLPAGPDGALDGRATPSPVAICGHGDHCGPALLGGMGPAQDRKAVAPGDERPPDFDRNL